MQDPQPFVKGDRVLFAREPRPGHDGGAKARSAAIGGRRDRPDKRLVTVGAGVQKIPGIGVIDMDRLVGLFPGAPYEVGRDAFRLFRPTTMDLLATVRRKAQIVTPKDAAAIILYAGIGPGSRVVEAGIGSGALSVAIASAFGPEGRLFNYEIREDFQRVGRENLERAGLADRVVFHLGDVRDGIGESNVDAVVLDMPSPWEVAEHARKALAPGGHIVCYTPLVSQMEQTVAALRKAGFIEVRACEHLLRDWVVKQEGARPDFSMLGHTAFLTTGRSPGPAADA